MFDLIELKARAAIRTTIPTDHVFVVDVSGSMYRSLPTMRDHLKNNISTMVKDTDTVSIIYFSGKGECGTVIKRQSVSSLKDQQEISNAIDKFLKPICLTGFVDPLNLANDIVSDSSNMKNLVFMTDGYSNTDSRKEILDVCSNISFDKATIIEYGNYCDRDLLSEMANIIGANHVFAEDITSLIDSTTVSFETEVIPKQEVKVAKNVSQVVYLDPKPVLVNVVDQIALVPESVTKVYAINKAKLGKTDDEDFKYIGVWVALHTGNSDLLWEAVNVLGDVHIFNKVQNAFTKQELQSVKELVVECIEDTSKRFLLGYKENLVPKEDAFTVLDLLQALNESKLGIHVNTFEGYKSGTKKREAVDQDIPKFKPYPEEFISASRLVFNETRPNVSIGTTVNGVVNIPLEKQKEFGLPALFDTFIHRNYTIVRDGILNVKTLFVECCNNLLDLLDDNEIMYTEHEHFVEISLDQIPLVNRQMVKNLNLKSFLNAKLTMLEYKAKNKILKELRTNITGLLSSDGLKKTYGEEATEYLNSIGIRDYGYGSVSTKTAETTDYYVAVELDTKIATSTLPKTEAALKKRTDGKKLNLGDTLVLKAYDEYKDLPLDELLKEEKKVAKLVLKMNKIVADTTYSLLVSKSWFKDTDDAEMVLTFNGIDVKCSVMVKNKNIPI